MRLCKILLEIRRNTSIMIEMPRYEVAVRRAVNPPGTKFTIHTRPAGDLSPDSFVDFADWREAWADLRARYKTVANEIYDATTFQDEYEATLARDGEGVQQNPAELTHSEWEPLMNIAGVTEELAKAMFADGLQSIHAVAAASLDTLEALPDSSITKSLEIQASARKLCDYADEAAIATNQEPDKAPELEVTVDSAPFITPDLAPAVVEAQPVSASPFELPPGD